MAIETTVSRLIEIVGGSCSGDAAKHVFNGVCTEVGAVRGGELFVSLDGNLVKQQAAFQRGASCILTSSDALLAEEAEVSGRLVLVEHVEDSLKQLSRWWLAQQEGLKTVLVCGEVGKTFVKELLARLLVASGRGTYTAASKNSVVDIAVTLCDLGHDDSWLVLEAASTALPSLADLQFDVLLCLGSTREGVKECLEKAPATDCSILFEPLASELETEGKRFQSFGTTAEATVYVKDIAMIGVRASSCTLHAGDEAQEVFCTVPGEHVALNIAAATTAYLALFPEATLQSIAAALRNFSAVPGCLYLHRIPGDRYLFDDTAHAGFASVHSFVSLARAARENDLKVAFIVGELEGDSVGLQELFVEELAAVAPNCIVCCGDAAETMQAVAKKRGVPAMIAATPDAAVHTARKFPWQVLLVKGGKNHQLKRAVSLILELEGEVLEIPQDLAQFGTGSLPEEE
jgi:UDP-N-acetylmuramyl pentapeptide synthase